jgi:hypothetical protein
MSLFDSKTNDEKICYIYDIDTEMLHELAEVNDYWEKALKFFIEVKDKTIDELSSSQIDWMDRIQNDYVKQWERLC